jgi:hypothetical protein
MKVYSPYMPRYFFHTADGSVDRDISGTELPNANAARTYAVKFAAECLAADPGYLWESGEFRIDVTDEQNRTVFTMISIAIAGPEYMKGGSAAE